MSKEAVNDSSKLVAQALEKLRPIQSEDCQQARDLYDAIQDLEKALEKLASSM